MVLAPTQPSTLYSRDVKFLLSRAESLPAKQLSECCLRLGQLGGRIMPNREVMPTKNASDGVAPQSSDDFDVPERHIVRRAIELEHCSFDTWVCGVASRCHRFRKASDWLPRCQNRGGREACAVRAAAPARAGWRGPERSTFGFQVPNLALRCGLRVSFLCRANLRLWYHL